MRDVLNGMTAVSTPPIGVDSRIRPARPGYTCLRILLATVLLTAAALKATQLVGNPLPETSLLTSRWFVVVVVEGELALGMLLLSGLYVLPVWGITLACFSSFVVVALYKGLSGETSCGCFGRVAINPWYMAACDLAAVAAMLWFRPSSAASYSHRSRRMRVAVVLSTIVIVGVPSGIIMAHSGPKASIVEGLIEGRSYTILEPQKWVGKRLPLLPRISIGERLVSGEWTVVLYHYDCPNCRTVLPEFVKTAEEWARARDRRRMAFIEVPPYAPVGENPVSGTFACLLGQLPEGRTWFVRTPTVITLVDGEVKAVSQEHAE